MTLTEIIHAEVDSVQNNLMVKAKQMTETTGNPKLEKINTLEGLGFINTPELLKLKQEAIAFDIEKKLYSELSYFQMTYPFLKTMPFDELKKILDKYNLVYASVSNYCKDVPDKNLNEIKNSQEVKVNDKVNFTIYHLSTNHTKDNIFLRSEDYSKFDKLKELMSKPRMFIKTRNIFSGDRDELVRHFLGQKDCEELNISNSVTYRFKDAISVHEANLSGLFIAAPKDHFKDLENLKSSGNGGFFSFLKTKSEKPKDEDPIVFRFVRDNFIQILSKWGVEAEDTSLVVPINN